MRARVVAHRRDLASYPWWQSSWRTGTMAGRKAAPKQSAPKATKRQRRSRVEVESDTSVDRSRMEEELVKLVDSLPQWTRDMQAVRPAAAETPSPRRRSP